MFGGLLDRWFPRDPTKAWPEGASALPDVDLARARVGPVRLGAPLEAARAFGRPSHTRPHGGKGGADLYYFEHGLRLGFESDRLVEVSLYLVPAVACPAHAQMRPARLRSPKGEVITPAADRAAVERWIGAPRSVHEDEDEVVLVVGEDGGVHHEVCLDRVHGLVSWELYSDD